MSHAGFLRDHGAEEANVIALVRALWAVPAAASDATAQARLSAVDEAVGTAAATWTGRGDDHELLRYVTRLTLAPRSVHRQHLDALSTIGLSTREIADVVHVACCFAYMNRLVDGLGVAVGADRERWARTLLGDSAWRAHVNWAQATADQD